MSGEAELRPIRYEGGVIHLLDQTLLPSAERWLRIGDVPALVEAIRSLRVRGAPAIGIAAAYGIALAARIAARQGIEREQLTGVLEEASRVLGGSRPTAVNLFWALRIMTAAAEDALKAGADVPGTATRLEEVAVQIHEDDIERCRAMGRHGAALLPDGAVVLTHCNTGALATGGYGTALGVIRQAHEQGRLECVYATETRPLLQGARLTAWELQRLGIPHRLIVDGAAAHVMRAKGVDAVIVGADRIAANGDVANKVGTFALALQAAALEIPFYVVAPLSSFDAELHSGEGIPIEERGDEEVLHLAGAPTAPEGTRVSAPAFDVTPARYIRAIVTERGVISPVIEEEVAAHHQR